MDLKNLSFSGHCTCMYVCMCGCMYMQYGSMYLVIFKYPLKLFEPLEVNCTDVCVCVLGFFFLFSAEYQDHKPLLHYLSCQRGSSRQDHKELVVEPSHSKEMALLHPGGHHWKCCSLCVSRMHFSLTELLTKIEDSTISENLERLRLEVLWGRVLCSLLPF